MKQVVKNEKKEIINWINWLNTRWNAYEAFADFEFGDNPEQVAENFLFSNEREFMAFLDDFDYEDLDAIDALDQFQKLAESESHVFKLIKKQINNINKVTYVDFKNKRLTKKDN